jgi:hypothetical protein
VQREKVEEKCKSGEVDGEGLAKILLKAVRQTVKLLLQKRR